MLAYMYFFMGGDLVWITSSYGFSEEDYIPCSQNSSVS